jgi:CRISPR-associated protein Cmr6
MGRAKRRGTGGPSGKKRPQQLPETRREDPARSAGSSMVPKTAPRTPGSTNTSVVQTPLFAQLTSELGKRTMTSSSAMRLAVAEDVDGIPMEFRAQIEDRCKRQKADLPDAGQWLKEWTQAASRSCPFEDLEDSATARTFQYQVDWRLISNSGTDSGIIRPVIAAQGWPIIPGSGIKGIFRRGCAISQSAELAEWCGYENKKETTPGILRFHGAWPADVSWHKSLLDLAHPQQEWQLGFNGNKGREKHNANAVISLLRPNLRVRISSAKSLTDEEWTGIRNALEVGLSGGLGGRTCAGYGGIRGLHPDPLLSFGLEGQGVASTLLNKQPEFRPNMFRAAIRGMALRLFAGLMDQRTTEDLVHELFGGFGGNGPVVGALASRFLVQSVDEDGVYGRGQATYKASGYLEWSLRRSSKLKEYEDELKRLLYALHSLVMVLGNFGRGWRRPDHSLFRLADREFYRRNAIGAHWQWLNPSQLPEWCHPFTPVDLRHLLVESRLIASNWLRLRRPGLSASGPVTAWREVLHSSKAKVWARLADSPNEAVAINWFHSQDCEPRIKKTALTGRMGEVGHLWNRMYPLQDSPAPAQSGADTQTSKLAVQRGVRRGTARVSPSTPPREQQSRLLSIDSFWKGQYLETLTYFVNARDCDKETEFLQYMSKRAYHEWGFQQIDYSDL